jgi:hypothetical protein
MSNLSLHRKVEKALTAYLQTIITTGITIYPGHDKASVVSVPHIIVYSEDCVPHPDMPTFTGIRIVTARFQIRVDSEVASARTSLDTWRKTIEDTLGSVPTILAALNPPAQGQDNRTITDLYFYDIIAGTEPTEFDRADWVEDVVVGVVCQPLDSRSA